MSYRNRYVVWRDNYRQRVFATLAEAVEYATKAQEVSERCEWPIPARFTVRWRGWELYDAADRIQIDITGRMVSPWAY